MGNNIKKSMLSHIVVIGLVSIITGGCKKLVEIDEPVNSITTKLVFSTDATANAAILGIYNKMAGSGFTYSSGALTVLCGLSSDELKYFGGFNDYLQFQSNSLQSNNSSILTSLWTDIYFNIYEANAIIEGLAASVSIKDSTKKVLTGEAKFLRAFCYFYLVNLYGDVPLSLTSSWSAIATMKRTPVSEVYKQIIADLVEARDLLPSDFSSSAGERTRVNKWAAMALLARAYLYTGKWSEAETEASFVINNSAQYELAYDLNEVFLKNSLESIWQLQVNAEFFPFATAEGFETLPYDFAWDYPPDYVEQNWEAFVPVYHLSPELINVFESDDQRKIKWCDSTGLLNGTNYFYSQKYKVRVGSRGDVVEYYSLLRLAEQYLIRAEARARLGKNAEAVEDINIIRNRAGLSDLPVMDQSQTLLAAYKEKQIEFFNEWGHRWFDLKRREQANAVLGPIKGANWQSSDQLYPIPISEIQRNPRLVQNAGYD
jgi:starch-binding outer membrane protein, SusD/RagB family